MNPIGPGCLVRLLERCGSRIAASRDAFLYAAMLLLPGAARAYGTPVYADGTPISAGAEYGHVGETVFPFIMIACAVAVSVAFAVNWGARALWRAAIKTQPPFDFFSVSALTLSFLLAALDVFVLPAFADLFASFGADLPAPTRLLLRFGHLLPVVFCLLLVMLYALRKNAWRERCFAGVLAAELALLLGYFVSVNSSVAM